MKKSISIPICVLIVLLLSVNILFAAEKATILVIQSYHTGNAWDDSYKLGLEKSLAAKYKLVYFEMDTKRIPKDQVQKKADLAWDKYQSIKPALVILADDAALKNLGPKFGETKTPVVYLGINNNPRNYFKAIPANITGILERPLLLRSIANLRDIIPGIKNVLVLFDDDITAEIVKKEVFSNKDKLDVLGINVELRMIGDYSTWQNSVTSAKDNFDACIAGLYQTLKNKDQKVINAEEVINWTSQHAVVPTFAFWDFAVGSNKAIGGTVIYGEDMGEKAAEFVSQILEKGKSPSDLLPIFSDQGQFMFSKSQLAKWKITLPAKITAKTNYVE